LIVCFTKFVFNRDVRPEKGLPGRCGGMTAIGDEPAPRRRDAAVARSHRIDRARVPKAASIMSV
jgi:hypothetical protein